MVESLKDRGYTSITMGPSTTAEQDINSYLKRYSGVDVARDDAGNLYQEKRVIDDSRYYGDLSLPQGLAGSINTALADGQATEPELLAGLCAYGNALKAGAEKEAHATQPYNSAALRKAYEILLPHMPHLQDVDPSLWSTNDDIAGLSVIVDQIDYKNPALVAKFEAEIRAPISAPSPDQSGLTRGLEGVAGGLVSGGSLASGALGGGLESAITDLKSKEEPAPVVEETRSAPVSRMPSL